MQALVLEATRELALRDIDLPQDLGAQDVRIRIHTVGICGSDLHYYTHGRIGPFKVEAPMVLGHEASGTIIEVGSAVTQLKVGDRVCMEPGIPRLDSPATLRGLYNLDPSVRFWATPPIHGCLTGSVVHPAAFTYRLPDNVSFAEGAIVEPLSIGLQAATKARMKPGDTAVVIGAGTIGAMTALAALAGGRGARDPGRCGGREAGALRQQSRRHHGGRDTAGPDRCGAAGHRGLGCRCGV